jgi:hypothetical protein
MPLTATAIRNAKPGDWSANRANRIIRRLERDIFPWIGGESVADVTSPQVAGGHPPY